MFGVYDFDGDGVITREEWAGRTRCSPRSTSMETGGSRPAELAAGLGAAFSLQQGTA